MTVLNDLTQQPMAIPSDIMARLALLEAENARLKAGRQRKLTLKVSAKGAVSLYGMGQWPVTLYKSQWLRLIDGIEDVKAFIEANGDLLTEKS